MMELLPHQKAELDATEHFNRVAYYHDMGLGKTYTGAEKMDRLGAQQNLVICQKSKIGDWIEHFNAYYPQYRVLDLTYKKRCSEFVQTGAVQTIGVINYDLAWRRQELLELDGFTLMLDESSLIQNEFTKRARFVLKLRAANVILLSGTPTGGKYEKLYSQLRLLGWDITKTLYYNQYVVTETMQLDGVYFKKVVGYKNVDRLKSKLAEHGARFLKTSDAGIVLPEQTIIPVKVPTIPAYKKFMRDGIVALDDVEFVGDTTLTKRLYARMLCGSYNLYKLEAFKDLLESTSDRVIVFYNFNEELHKLKDICHDSARPVSVINGSERDLVVYDECSDAVTLVQYQAGAMGLNLQKANKTIYYTLPQSYDVFEQSHKRTSRIGQTRPCFYYYLMCAGSVEEHILQTLKLRKHYTDELFREYEKGAN